MFINWSKRMCTIGSSLDCRGAGLNPFRTTDIPKDVCCILQKRYAPGLAGHGGFSVEYDSCFTQEQRGRSIVNHGHTLRTPTSTSSCPWQWQSRRLVGRLALMVNGGATSGQVSQPNTILIGKLLGNSLTWPEGTEIVSCLAVNTDRNMIFPADAKQHTCI